MGLGQFRGYAMPLIVLALATWGPAAEARGPGAPLPPLAVQASATDAGALVTWLPPASEGSTQLVAYHVYRLENAGASVRWEPVGSTGPDVLSFLDPSGTAAAYAVAAENLHEASLLSPATTAGQACDAVGLAGTPPQLVVNWDCIGDSAESASDALQLQSRCDAFVLAGTPPQLVVNWNCIGDSVWLKILHLRG